MMRDVFITEWAEQIGTIIALWSGLYGIIHTFHFHYINLFYCKNYPATKKPFVTGYDSIRRKKIKIFF